MNGKFWEGGMMREKRDLMFRVPVERSMRWGEQGIREESLRRKGHTPEICHLREDSDSWGEGSGIQ
jgi:hypothetical protein